MSETSPSVCNFFQYYVSMFYFSYVCCLKMILFFDKISIQEFEFEFHIRPLSFLLLMNSKSLVNFGYIVSVNFMGGRNRRKLQTCFKSLTNFILSSTKYVLLWTQNQTNYLQWWWQARIAQVKINKTTILSWPHNTYH